MQIHAMRRQPGLEKSDAPHEHNHNIDLRHVAMVDSIQERIFDLLFFSSTSSACRLDLMNFVNAVSPMCRDDDEAEIFNTNFVGANNTTVLVNRFGIQRNFDIVIFSRQDFPGDRIDKLNLFIEACGVS